jgi:hypothetical protein
MEKRVFFGVMTQNLFDGWVYETEENHDQQASAEKYAELCKTTIEKVMGNVEVEYEIAHDIGGSLPSRMITRVDGETPDNSRDAEWVDHICGEVFEYFDEWLVKKEQES